MVSSALAIGDLISLKIKKREIQEAEKMNSNHSRIFYLLSVLVFVIPVFHYWKAGTLPVYSEYFEKLTAAQVSVLREDFDKLLQVPYFFKVVINWVANIFGPLLVVWCISKRKKVIALGVFVWIFFYASASSADGPVIMFIWLIAFGVSHKVYKSKSLGNLIAGGITLALIFIVLSGVVLGNFATHKSNGCPTEVEVGFTPGDVLRACDEKVQFFVNPVMDRLGYRFFLTPVEVSNHWYDYFDGEPSDRRNFLNIFERDISNQASNKVGNWAYVSKFPESYAKTISANASIDADAFSFYGLLSVSITALMLFVIRIFISFTSVKATEFELILGGLGLGMLAFLPITAPLQAILLPQGLGLILFLLLFLRRKDLWVTLKARLTNGHQQRTGLI
jgi:hypothetical protein